MCPLAAQRTNQCRPSLKNPRTKTLRRGLGEEYLWAAIVTYRDASPILEPAEYDLDKISAFVAALIRQKRKLARTSIPKPKTFKQPMQQ